MPKHSLKTKKNKLRIKRKKLTYKKQYYGGDALNTANSNAVNKIMEQVKSERKLDLGNMEILQKTQNLLKGLFLQATESIAKIANVNINNPISTDQKLQQIKEALINPANKEKLKEIISELSKNGAIAIQAASPFIKEFLDKLVPIGTKTMSQWGEAIVKIGLNTATEIPGVGILVGTIRSIGNAGEAIAASTNAAAEIVTSSSDAIKGAIMNYKKITQENMGRLNNINTSINEFQKPLQLPQQLVTSTNMIRGGKYNRYSRRK
jgi:hypothetical protein